MYWKHTFSYTLHLNYTEHCSVGPTKLIETTTRTTRMKISDEDFEWRFLRWPDGESALKQSEDRCYKKSHRIAKCGSIWKRKTDLEYGMVKDYGYVIILSDGL